MGWRKLKINQRWMGIGEPGKRENLLGQENAKDLKQREKNGGKKRREREHDK